MEALLEEDVGGEAGLHLHSKYIMGAMRRSNCADARLAAR